MSAAVVNHELALASGALLVERMSDDLKKLEAQAVSEEERARNALVQSDADCEIVSAEMVRLKTLIQAAQERFDPIVDAAYKAHSEACKQRRLVIDPLQRALNLLGPKVAGFLQRKKQEEEARRQREIEESRLRAAAEREREIEQAEANNASREEVEALCAMPLPAAVVTAPRRAVASGPVSTRDSYKALVTNKLALLQYVAKNPQYLNLWNVNESALNQLARSLKTALQIPGVEVINEAIAATRTAARKSGR